MLSTAKMTLETFFRSATSLSRAIRRHMKEVVHSHKKFQEKIEPALESARKIGAVDQITSSEKDAEKTIITKGQLLLLDDQEKVAAVERKVEGEVKDIGQIINHIEKKAAHLPSNTPEEKHARMALHQVIAEAHHDLHDMFKKMHDAIQDSYTAIFAESRDEVDAAKHALKALGVARVGDESFGLAEAMRNVFKLRSDKRLVHKDVSDFEALDHVMESEIMEMEQDHTKLQSLLPRLEKQEQQFAHLAKEIVKIISVNMRRYVTIIQFFVAYFFILRNTDEGHLKKFLHILENEGFPKDVHDRLAVSLDKKDAEVKAHIAEIGDIITWQRHVAEAGESATS